MSGGEIDVGLLGSLVGYHLRRAQARVFDDFMRTMAGDGITPAQIGVLAIIDANPGLNQSALARALGIERSTMVGVIDTLEGRLLLRREEAVDKRSHALRLSQEGETLLRAVEPKIRSHERRLLRNLDAQETRTLVSLLKRLG